MKVFKIPSVYPQKITLSIPLLSFLWDLPLGHGVIRKQGSPTSGLLPVVVLSFNSLYFDCIHCLLNTFLHWTHARKKILLALKTKILINSNIYYIIFLISCTLSSKQRAEMDLKKKSIFLYHRLVIPNVRNVVLQRSTVSCTALQYCTQAFGG